MQPVVRSSYSYIMIAVSPLRKILPRSYMGAVSQRPFASPAPSSFAPNSKSLFNLLFVVELLSCRFPILHQLLIGRQLKYLHHEHVSRYL